MPYSKIRNTYGKNNYQSYNKSLIGNTQRFYLNTNLYSYPNRGNYDDRYESKHLITGGDVSGTVFINNGYDVAKEDPGISWVL